MTSNKDNPPTEEVVSAFAMTTSTSDATAGNDDSSTPFTAATGACLDHRPTTTQNRARPSDDAEVREELEQEDDVVVMVYVDGLNDADEHHQDDRQNGDDAEETGSTSSSMPRRRRRRSHRRSHRIDHTNEAPTRLFQPRARELHPSSFADTILALVDLEESSPSMPANLTIN